LTGRVRETRVLSVSFVAARLWSGQESFDVKFRHR
jgi:hypothetical protein